jgi:hypothetical protein
MNERAAIASLANALKKEITRYFCCAQVWMWFFNRMGKRTSIALRTNALHIKFARTKREVLRPIMRAGFFVIVPLLDLSYRHRNMGKRTSCALSAPTLSEKLTGAKDIRSFGGGTNNIAAVRREGRGDVQQLPATSTVNPTPLSQKTRNRLAWGIRPND